MKERIKTDVFDSIDQISAKSWDSVAGKSICIHHTMLRCQENSYSGFGEPRYFQVRKCGHVMAVSVAVLCNHTREALLTERIFGRLKVLTRPITHSLDKALVCGYITGPGAAIMVRADISERYWIGMMCGVMEDYARSMGLNLAFLCVPPRHSILSAELRRRGYLQGIDRPIATLDITWSDTRSYIKQLRQRKKRYAAAIKYEIRRFHKSGAIISRWKGSNSNELYQLLRQHYEAHNTPNFHFSPDILDQLVSRLGDDCIVYIARKEVALIGVCVFLRRCDKAWAWLIGIDHKAGPDIFTYFNLAFYHSCSQFPLLGVRQAYFGNAVQYAKYRRGCDIIDVRFFLKPASTLLAWVLQPIFVIHRTIFRRKYFSWMGETSKGST